MSAIIKFDLRELRKLAKDKDTCVIEKRLTQNLAVQPWCLGNLKDSVKNILDYKIGKYDKELNGILLSYKNLRILHNVGAIKNDNCDIHFQIQVDYFIFRPFVGATLRGVVNKKSISHLGVLVHRVFNVVIPRPTDEPGSKWIGNTVKEGQVVTFKIRAQDLFGALPYIRGELDEKSLKAATDTDIKLACQNEYVNFDKTKPCINKKQSGDAFPEEVKPKRRSFPNTASNSGLSSQVKLKIEHDQDSPEKDRNKARVRTSKNDLVPTPRKIKKF